MAEAALLHHAARPDGNVRVQPLRHRLRPLGTLPVEVPNGVGTGRRAVPAADAARVDLGDEPFPVDLCRLDGADLRARGSIALHAGQRDEPETGARPVFALFERDEAQPRDGAAPRRLLGARRRDVVLDLTGDDAGLARGTPVEIDHHSPARHRLRPPLPGETRRRRCRDLHLRRVEIGQVAQRVPRGREKLERIRADPAGPAPSGALAESERDRNDARHDAWRDPRARPRSCPEATRRGSRRGPRCRAGPRFPG